MLSQCLLLTGILEVSGGNLEYTTISISELTQLLHMSNIKIIYNTHYSYDIMTIISTNYNNNSLGIKDELNY